MVIAKWTYTEHTWEWQPRTNNKTKQRLNGLSNADTLTTTIKQSHKEGERCQYVNHHGKAKLKIKQISNATDALTTTQVAGQAVQQILKATDTLNTTQVAGRSVQHKSEGRLSKQHLTLKWWEGHPCQNKDMKHHAEEVRRAPCANAKDKTAIGN